MTKAIEPGNVAAGADELGDVFGERTVGVVLADECDAEQLVMPLEVVEADRVEAKCDQPGVECDDAGVEVAVDERVGGAT